MTNPLNDDELQRILGEDNIRGTVSMIRPLELFLETKFLQNLCRESLNRLREEPPPTDPQKRRLYYRAVQQRIDFAAWLQAQRDEEIYMALYPVAEDGLDDDDLDDLLEDLPEFP